MRLIFKFLGVSAVFAVLFAFHIVCLHTHIAAAQEPASLFVSPAGGSFTVGSTFTVSIFLNTNGESVNAIDMAVRFPADKLQVVSPSSGRSIIGVWVAQPTYDNREGTLRFRGAIPNPGINTSQGLVSAITFRVVSTGLATIRIDDESKVLLNDGKGTDVFGQVGNGVYRLALPPPAGPIVASPDRPDQERWYNTPTATFEWAGDGAVEGYSYVLNDQPVDAPDDISEGTKNSQFYRTISDGNSFFHIKSLRNGVWGGVTHYALKIDTKPPAEFPIAISPNARTSARRVTISFETTDALSGVDRYELKIIPLTPGGAKPTTEQSFFIETESPYITDLEEGDYDIVVRAHDRAGNYVQETQRLEIVQAVFEVVSTQGIRFRGNILMSWAWFWGIIGGLVAILVVVAIVVRRRHHQVHQARESKELPAEIQKKLHELQKLQEKYKRLAIVFLCVAATLSLMGMRVHAADIRLASPVVDMVSRSISNEEIFYIGGFTDVAGAEVVIYYQEVRTGETRSVSVKADTDGRWFYSHETFLPAGRYALWAQTKVGEELSPPTPQVQLEVVPTAFQIGSSKLSYEFVYAVALLVLASILLILVGFILYHFRAERRKRHHMREELRQAEESIRRGFAMLRRDIEEELSAIQRAKSIKDLAEHEKEREARIAEDLARIKSYVGKEIWELEREV